MIEEGEDELICDLAETYRIYDYKKLPIDYVSILACGLRSDSRIKMKLMDEPDLKYLETKLNVMLYDKINWIAWSRSKDGQDGVNRPSSIYSMIYEQSHESEYMTFESGSEFASEWNKRIKHGNNNS